MRQYLAESLETVTVEEGHEQAGSGFWRIAARPPGALFPMRLSGIWPWCSFSFGNKCISGVLESVTGMQRMKPGYCSYPCFISRRKVNEASKSGHKLLTQLCKMGRKQQLGEPWPDSGINVRGLAVSGWCSDWSPALESEVWESYLCCYF